MVILPRATAVPNTDDPVAQTAAGSPHPADHWAGPHGLSADHCYSRRGLIETATRRYTHLSGLKLLARTLAGEQGEAPLAVALSTA